MRANYKNAFCKCSENKYFSASKCEDILNIFWHEQFMLYLQVATDILHIPTLQTSGKALLDYVELFQIS